MENLDRLVKRSRPFSTTTLKSKLCALAIVPAIGERGACASVSVFVSKDTLPCPDSLQHSQVSIAQPLLRIPAIRAELAADCELHTVSFIL